MQLRYDGFVIKKYFQEEIKRITNQVIKNYQPQKIILFGSAARGDFNENSDVDMLIVKDAPGRRVDRIKNLLFSVDYNLPFEPLVYTPQELKEREKLGDSFILEVLSQGQILYEQ